VAKITSRTQRETSFCQLVVIRNGSRDAWLIPKILIYNHKIQNSNPPLLLSPPRSSDVMPNPTALIARARTMFWCDKADEHRSGNDDQIAL
jgi:hypothetical protein